MDEKYPGVDAERMSGRAEELLHGRGPEGARESMTRTLASDVRRDDGREAGADSDTRHIRATIAETREEMAQTISAIQDRVSPTNVASRVVESVRDDVRERAHGWAQSNGGRYVRAHPMRSVAILAGGGATIGWLLLGRRPHRRGYLRPLRPIGEQPVPGSGELSRSRYDAGAEYRAQNSQESGDWGATVSPSAGLEVPAAPPTGETAGATRSRSERPRANRPRVNGFTVALFAAAGVAAWRRAREEMNQARGSSSAPGIS